MGESNLSRIDVKVRTELSALFFKILLSLLDLVGLEPNFNQTAVKEFEFFCIYGCLEKGLLRLLQIIFQEQYLALPIVTHSLQLRGITCKSKTFH